MPRGDSYQLQGQNGWECIDDTSAHTNGDDGFRWSQAIEDTVISAISGTDLTNAAGLAGPTITAGTAFGGHISSITLTSGTVLAYKA